MDKTEVELGESSDDHANETIIGSGWFSLALASSPWAFMNPKNTSTELDSL